jgi:glutathione S-transferase
MKLYFSPGACSLASNITLRELGLPFEAVQVDLKAKRTKAGADYSAISPKGYVPALELDDGQILTEGTAILQYLADLKPAAGLAPPPAAFERYRLQEWLGFINSEIHKGFSPLFNPATPEATRENAKALLAKRFQFIVNALAGRDYLLGRFTVADAYLYTVLSWAPRLGVDLAPFPALSAYHARIGERASVKAARAAESPG